VSEKSTFLDISPSSWLI